MENIKRPVQVNQQDNIIQSEQNMKEFTEEQFHNIYDYLDKMAKTFAEPLDIYPVGSIYISINNVNPSKLFGGTWELIPKDFYLMASENGGGEAVNGTSNTRDISHTHKQSTINQKCYDSSTYSGVSYGADTRLIVRDNTYSTYSGGNTKLNIQPASIAVCMWIRTE